MGSCLKYYKAKDAAQDRSRKGGKSEQHQNPTKGEEPHDHPDGKNHREHHTYLKKWVHEMRSIKK